MRKHVLDPLSIEGKTFGKIKVIKFKEKINYFNFFHCVCNCGKEVVMRGDGIISGRILSCGCGRRKSNAKYKHPLYFTWSAMFFRCENPISPTFKNYGGKGVSICKRWKGEMGFWNFIKDMGPKPNDKYSIDRINNDGNYEPSNCRWATNSQQRSNTSRNVFISINGEKKTVTEWSIIFGIPRGIIYKRKSEGWSDSDCFLPLHKKIKRGNNDVVG